MCHLLFCCIVIMTFWIFLNFYFSNFCYSVHCFEIFQLGIPFLLFSFSIINSIEW
ncbi:hypothetical protein RchiOBHm_Chr7g0201811 [Rosa chinensis]|uniref:Uncharacterized protein n=1 Tax=Rosa chinensis TaxID=74649 RepID=A0A2P6P815_ROSCH|nr:hypothetical protein RchiOBHm_Chr7g0201811 [Rosa chinensis]